MPKSITIGGIDRASYALREGAALPLLTDDVPAQAWFADCLKQVIVERHGVIVLGQQGCGKSVAMACDLMRFTEVEEARRREKDASYMPRRVVGLTTVRADSARELFVRLYRAAFDTNPAERVYRRTKTSDELRDELIARCVEENVVGFVIDEAQTLTDVALEALRDLMAAAEHACPKRIEHSPAGKKVRPGGIGVLLVGTLALVPRLPKMTADERRWTRAEVVGTPEEAAIPGILRHMLPAFAAGAERLGDDPWAALVQRELTRGRGIPISTIYDLAQVYVRRASAEQPKARKLSDLTWDEELFRQCVNEMIGLQILGQEAA